MRFIQYMHPAAQARTDASGLCPANPGPRHQRKFFQVASGHWQAAPHAPVQEGPLAFWGSWEQATRYTPLPASSDKAAPVAAHQPVLSGRARHGKDAVRALPTHPFVFDAPFLFLPGKDSPNRMLSRLEPGDIVVFGSHLHGQFALDTVFVVNGRTPVGDTQVSQLFRRVNDSCFDDTTLPVYRGACLNQPLGALVSFFPAKPATAGEIAAFNRPTLTPVGALEDLVQPRLPHNFRGRETLLPAGAVWDEICRQVMAQGCVLGLSAS
ncbi:hypothetical protein [Rivihabitans pingtungensis]|jgi:hypothetical protein|uniref:hypothetical protein n=1 Tax=Rivihabitans pingtungensis TaxID=1054498 RepID=UPI0023529198|nr:hypothetical protein [Rivihabitans pingtungensis]MCK6437301.1 hypothetical protein [Rivihabitans pingtungensis]HNX69753.1 hypothetical protein [Rivihabitans pingtungensis]